jgi:hypothetical protein
MFCIAYGITGEARTRAMLLEAAELKHVIRSMVDIVETHNSDLMCGHRAHGATSSHPYGNPDVFQHWHG